MKIKQAKFVSSVVGNEQFPGRGLPQIAVAGKSNVGKSSLINCLANQKRLAKTSQEPGKTRLVNMFLFNDDFHLADLPGYGYARVPKGMQEDWGRMMSEFLNGSECLVHILHLVDIRHEPGEHDKAMAEWIRESGVSCTVVATKADKLSKSQQLRSVGIIGKALTVDEGDIVPFSSVDRQGKDELVGRIEHALERE